MEGVNITVGLVGVALLVAAVVGGGLKLAGTEIPVLNTWGRQLVVGVIGVVILIFAWVTRADFRVTGASIRADQIAVTLCPATVSYTGTIEVMGGKGEVQYRFVHNGQPSGHHSVSFEAAGSEAVSESFAVTPTPAGLPRLGPDRAYLEILAPAQLTSEIAQIQVLC